MTSLGALIPKYQLLFYMDRTDAASQYDLVAHTSNANESYCGTYGCIENRGTGDNRTATVASKCIYYVVKTSACAPRQSAATESIKHHYSITVVTEIKRYCTILSLVTFL